MKRRLMPGACLLWLILMAVSGCQSLVNYQDSLYMPDNKPISRGPDFPFYHVRFKDIYPNLGITITRVLLADSPQGAGGSWKDIENVYWVDGSARLVQNTDYSRGFGSAVSYTYELDNAYDLKTTKWLADLLMPVVESKPPMSRNTAKHIYPSDKVIEDNDLVVNGLAWRHRYAFSYNRCNDIDERSPYEPKPCSLSNAYEIYAHKLTGGQLLIVRGNYKPEVTADPSWIAARRKTLRDMVGFIHVDPLPADYVPPPPPPLNRDGIGAVEKSKPSPNP